MPFVSPGRKLEEYLAPFRPDLRRPEQFRWVRAYVTGLLADIPRKNVEGIARHLSACEDARTEDVRQALQNFLQVSPWNEQHLLQRYRQDIWRRFAGAGVLAIEDVVLVKQGRYSAGVHRQFSAEHEAKLNCQVIPSVFLLAGDACVPLAMRLYLPRAWQEDVPRLERCKVPPPCRVPASRLDVAHSLLQLLRDEGAPDRRVVLGNGYRHIPEAAPALTATGFELATADSTRQESEADVRGCVHVLKHRLGLDHFEGRSWRGLHHHLALVLLASGFQLQDRCPGAVGEPAGSGSDRTATA